MTRHALYLALRWSIAGLASTAAAQDVDLANLGERGYRIEGVAAEDRLGRAVSGAGDVNGDGLADVIVASYRADPDGRVDAGSVYVLCGKADNATVDVGNLGAAGFRIDGIDGADEAGRSVSGAGDVNGDGLADLLIGAHQAAPSGINGAGESYVVFGKADGTLVDLANLGSGGFRIDGIDAGDRSGNSVSGAGDVNGDGLADLLIGATNAGDNAGESYVVFGKSDSATVDLTTLGNGGFRIDGAGGDRSGSAVSGAGDVNGDGLADVLIGAFLLAKGYESEGDLVAGSSPTTVASSSGPPPTGLTTTSTTAPSTTTTPLKAPADVTVRVANGGGEEGVALAGTEKLAAAGYSTLGAVDAPAQTASVVYYAAGFEGEAVEVAKVFDIPETSVEELPAAPPTDPGGADVLVILGPEQKLTN